MQGGKNTNGIPSETDIREGFCESCWYHWNLYGSRECHNPDAKNWRPWSKLRRKDWEPCVWWKPKWEPMREEYDYDKEWN